MTPDQLFWTDEEEGLLGFAREIQLGRRNNESIRWRRVRPSDT
jgi:hypothetical protein